MSHVPQRELQYYCFYLCLNYLCETLIKFNFNFIGSKWLGHIITGSWTKFGHWNFNRFRIRTWSNCSWSAANFHWSNPFEETDKSTGMFMEFSFFFFLHDFATFFWSNFYRTFFLLLNLLNDKMANIFNYRERTFRRMSYRILMEILEMTYRISFLFLEN